MSLLLAIETSGKFGSVALASLGDNSWVDYPFVDLPRNVGSAQSLVPSIERLLSEHSVSLDAIRCIALVSGPGSFTGLRVGIATAKSLAYALGIQVVGLDTLEVLQLQATVIAAESLNDSLGTPLRGEHTHALLDAYRGQLFVKSQDRTGRQSESRVIDILEFLIWCRELEQDPAQHIMVGPGVERWNRFLERELDEAELRDWANRTGRLNLAPLEPHARFVAKLGLDRWAQGLQTDPISLLPNYFRGSAAEEKAKAV